MYTNLNNMELSIFKIEKYCLQYSNVYISKSDIELFLIILE